MNLEEARGLAAEILGEARPSDVYRPLIEVGRREGEGKSFAEQLEAMTPPGLSIPGLLLFAFVGLLGFVPYGPEEKMRWGVRFEFRGQIFAFQHQKFGLRFLCEPSNLDSPLVQDVLGRARGLARLVEQFLADGYVAQQFARGLLTIQNLYYPLNFRYRYLREQAQAAYRRPPPEPVTTETAFGTATTYDPRRPQMEGGAFATAAVDAYFSRQEHLFVLSAGFVDRILAEGDLFSFLGSNWPTKARRALDLGDREAKEFYDWLLSLREQWRNPLAHGGFLSGGASLYFHLPGIGALPARLTRTPEGVHLGFALQRESFDEICARFDAFDAFLANGPLRFPLKWAKAGLESLSILPVGSATRKRCDRTKALTTLSSMRRTSTLSTQTWTTERRPPFPPLLTLDQLRDAREDSNHPFPIRKRHV